MPWRDRIPAWLPRALAILAVAGLVGWSAWQRWRLLATTPYPMGIDGYFYPLQLRALLETGHLQYPASPLVFWWMLPFAAATDPITGAKLGAAIGGALVAVPAYLVGAQLGRGRGPGLVAAAIATTSLGSTYLTIEFVKNGVGLTVALTALWLVLRAAVAERVTWRQVVPAAMAVVAALLAHKMAAGLVVVIGGPALAARLAWRRAVVGGAVVAATFVVLGLVAARRFVSPDDLAMLGQVLAPTARWDAPALALPATVAAPAFTLTMGHEALAGAVVALVAAAVLVMRARLGYAPPRPIRAATWGAIGLALAIGFPLLAVGDPQGLGFRLRIAAFVPLALLAAVATRVVIVRLASLDADGLALALAVAVVLRAPDGRGRQGQYVPHPALVSAVINAEIPAGTTAIVPERQIAFMVAWYTRAPVSLHPGTPPQVRVLPLMFSGDVGSSLDAALTEARRTPGIAPPIGSHPGNANGLVVVTEATWTWLLDHLPPADRAYYAAWPVI